MLSEFSTWIVCDMYVKTRSMENSIVLFTLTLVIVSFGTSFPTSECPCGYGGLCIGNADTASCSSCKDVSDGWYQNDCYTMVDHCHSSPCVRGKCVSTFGGYFCKCPPHYTGTNCEKDWRLIGLESVTPSNEVIIYHQLQPKPAGRKTFTVIYNATEWELKKWKTILEIHVTDGRRYYPTREQFVRRNVYNHCVREAERYPALLDSRVCKKLPKGRVLTFSLDPYLNKRSHDRTNLVFVPELEDAVGRTGYVELDVKVRINDATFITVYRHQYKVFTYLHPSRAPYNCVMDFLFYGCSTDERYPEVRPRGVLIKIQAKKFEAICEGVRIIKRAWYHQSLAGDYGNLDPVPTLLEYENKDTLVLPQFALINGKHMFVFEYTIQGNPPHYGGTAVFKKTGHCWIKAEMGNIDVHLKGGDARTLSCLNPSEVSLENYNPNMDLSEMEFTIECDNPKDRDCERRELQVPMIRKRHIPDCSTTLTYTVTVLHRSGSSNTSDIFKAYFEFVPLDVEIGITCSYNCNPVNPAYKSIWVAYTLPYIPKRVTWEVRYSLDSNMEIQAQEVRSFYPVTASRILVTKPNIFRKYIEEDEEIILQVSHGVLVAGLYASIYDIEYYVKGFSLNRVEGKSNEYKYEAEQEIQFGQYYVFLIDKPTLGVIRLLKSNYIRLLNFVPYWSTVCLCVHDAAHVFGCSQISEVNATEEAVQATDVLDLDQLLESGRVRDFLRGADYLLWKGVTSTEGKPYQWRLSLEERFHIVNQVEKVISLHTHQADFVTILHIFSMLFFSAVGNRNEGMPHFKDDFKDPLDVEYILLWMNFRLKALNCLLTVAQNMENHSKQERFNHLQLFPFGDILDRFMRTFSLAHAQGSAIRSVIKNARVSNFLTGEIAYSSIRNPKILENILETYAKALANYMTLYYGVTTYGVNHAKLWSINDSYTGLYNALNRSDKDGGLKIFGSTRPGPHWFSKVDLILPPTPYELQYKELSLTVVLVKNQPFDVYHSPILTLLLRTRSGDYIKRLPGDLKYRIVLPIMEDGKLSTVPLEKKRFNDTIERSEPISDLKSVLYSRPYKFNAYKLTFPSVYDAFTLVIFLSRPIPLKVKIRLDHVPDFDEVLQSPYLDIVKDNNSASHISRIIIQPEPGKSTLPKTVYFGILPSKKLPIGDKLEMFFYTTVIICRTRDVDHDEDEEDCQRVDVETAWNDLDVVCECKKWGITGLYRSAIRIAKFFISNVPLLTSYLPPNAFVELCFETVLLVILAILALVVANIFDRKRRNKECLIFTRDCYRSSIFLLVIGVYTGHKVGAGTISTVAVQLKGQKGFSRVILLKPTKSINRKTLQRGHDDWFVITSRVHLGKINAVYIWYNFRCTSSWYCTQILIYDATTYQWFKAEVNHWFKLTESSEASRLVRFEAQEYQATGSSNTRDFMNHFIVELENTHHIWSIFKMHPRVLYTHEQKTTIFVVKVLTICCCVFFALEVLLGYYSDPQTSKQLIDLRGDTFLIAVVVSLISTLSVIPLESLYRIGHLSSIIQKKTTNPLQLDTAKDVRGSMRSLRNEQRKSRQSKQLGTRRSDPSTKDIPVRKPTVQSDVGSLRKPLKGKIFSWSHARAIYLSPCQFYWVNAKTEIMDFKMRYITAFARFAAIFALLVLWASVLYILWGTLFIIKAYTGVCLVIITLVVDALIVNPIYILIRSLTIFFLLEVSNKEVVILNEETKFILPKTLPYVDYITMVTRKDYKPLLSSEIEKLKQIDIIKRFTMEALFFILGVAAAVLCFKMSFETNDQSVFYGIRAMNLLKTEFVIRERGYVWRGIGLEGVTGPRNATAYIVSNFIQEDEKWYSGKYISSDKRKWTRDYNSRKIDANLMLFVFMSNRSTLRLPAIFRDYYGTPYGYLSEGALYTKPLKLQFSELYYNKVYPGSFRAKSGEYYKFEGYNTSLPFKNMRRHYARLKSTLHSIMEKTTFHPLRAMFTSINFVNGFTKHVFTVDLLVEFHPSGICSAVIKINASVVEPGSSYKLQLLFLIVIYVSMLIIVFVTLHYSCLEDLWKKILSLSIFLVVLVITYGDYKRRLDTLNSLKYNPDDTYLDLHTFHKKGFSATLYLLFFPFLVLLYTVLIIRSLVGPSSFKNKFRSIISKYFSFYLFGVIVLQVIVMCYSNMHVFRVLMEYYSKSAIHIKDAFKTPELTVVILLLVVFHRICTALIAYEYFNCDEKFGIDRNNLFIRLLRSFKSHEAGKVAFNKRRSHKHSAERIHQNSPSRKESGAVIHRVDSSSDLHGPSTAQLQPRVSRPSALLQRKFRLFGDRI